MKSKKIYISIAVVIAMLCVVWCVCCFVIQNANQVVTIDDISQYNVEELSLWGVFPNQIPSCVVDAQYHYSKYYSNCDANLVMVFDTRQSMEQFLMETEEVTLEGDFLKKDNPHDEGWIDIFPLKGGAATYSSGEAEDFFYYEIEPEAKLSRISAYYTVISYSYDLLTVYITHFDGIRLIENKTVDLIPQYLKKFRIDTETAAEYYVKIN